MAYESKATVTQIRGISKATVKVRDNYYSIEVEETRSLPEDDSVNVAEEKKIMFDSLNDTVDNQIADIIKMYK